MSGVDWLLVGTIVAGILAGIQLIRSEARDLTAWAVLVLVVAMLLARYA